jgi:hypothetical protein
MLAKLLASSSVACLYDSLYQEAPWLTRFGKHFMCTAAVTASSRAPCHKSCRTPGVVQLCGTLDDAANLCLVFEPCRGGDLYKRLAHCGLLSEVQLCKEVRAFAAAAAVFA